MFHFRSVCLNDFNVINHNFNEHVIKTIVLNHKMIDYNCDPVDAKVVEKMNLISNDVKFSTFRRNVEKEFYNSFKNFLWMNQMFCTVPVKLDLLETSSKWKMKILSGLHMFYGLLICVCVSVATFWQHDQFNTSIGFLTTVLFMTEYIFGLISLLLVIIGCHYQKKYYKIFFERLINVDLNLQKCGVQPNFDSTATYIRRCMFVFTIFFSIVVAVDKFSHTDSFIIRSAVYSIPNMVTTLALMQYSTVLDYIQDKLKTINAVLQQLATSNKFMDHQHIVNNKLNIISVFSMNVGQNGTDKILNILRKQHAELSRLMELLNRCFGLLIILTMIVAYVALLSQFFEFYKMTVGIDNVITWLTAYTTLWMVLQCGKVTLVLRSTDDFSEERKRTGKLLYEMDLTERSSNHQRQAIVKTFSDQLLHETSPPNAMRIINLDMTIVATMLGVLTTYLIILIQFDVSDREQNKDQAKTVFKDTNDS